MSELSGRELDAAVAEKVMGLDVKMCEYLHSQSRWIDGKGTSVQSPSPCSWVNPGMWHPIPAYSTDLNACREAELKAVEMFGWDAYAEALGQYADFDKTVLDLDPTVKMNKWRCASELARAFCLATAEQRCRAILKAHEGRKG